MCNWYLLNIKIIQDVRLKEENPSRILDIFVSKEGVEHDICEPTEVFLSYIANDNSVGATGVCLAVVKESDARQLATPYNMFKPITNMLQL